MVSMRALAAVLPDHAFFIGPSAALLWGLPVPSETLRYPTVGSVRPHSAVRRSGVLSHRFQLALVDTDADVVQRLRMPTLNPVATWATLAPHLSHSDLVAVADALLWKPRDPGGWHPERSRAATATRSELQGMIARGRWAGIKQLRAALEQCSDSCASRPETHLRLQVAAAGLPEPVLNQDIWDGAEWLGCADQQYPDFKVCVEYQGFHHREAQQYDMDLNRRQRLQRAGWIVVELTSVHLYTYPGEAVHRIRMALTERGYRSS